MTIINWIKCHQVEVAFIVLIFMVGGFFRFYNVGDYMHFAGDEARDAFMVRSIAREGDIQLLGPSISPGEKAFSLGPFYYYFLVPAYWLSNNSPASGAVTAAIFSFLSIGLLYYIARKWYGVISAIVSSFLYSVSWIVIYYGRWVWNPNFVPFFMLALIICLYYLVKADDKHKKWWLVGTAIFFAILTQLHGTALYILPPLLLIYFLIFRPKIKWPYYLLALLVIVTFYIPVIIYDLQNDFANSRGFVELLTGRESSGSGILSSIKSAYNKFFDFYHETLAHQEAALLSIVVFASAVAIIFNNLYLNIKKKKKSVKNILVLLWLFIPFMVFIFFGDFIPPHYFSIVFPLSFLMVGGLMQFIFKIKWLRILTIVIPAVFGGILIYYSTQMLIDLRPAGSRDSTYQVTYMELEQVVNYIISDSQGQPYKFESVPAGVYDLSYEYMFDQQNYRVYYNDPVIEYTVIAGQNFDVSEYIVGSSDIKSKRFGNVVLIKNTN